MIRLHVFRLRPYGLAGGWMYEIRDTSRPEGHQIRFAVTAASWRHALRNGLADLRRLHETSGT